MRWAWDKKNTYDRAAELGIPVPHTYNPRTEEELEELYSRLPLAIKPAVKENFFYATGAKAWRAETPEQLKDLFRKATRQIRPEEILIQEIIPGMDSNNTPTVPSFVMAKRRVPWWQADTPASARIWPGSDIC